MQIDRPIAIAVTLFIIVLLIFFLVAPRFNEYKNFQQQIGQKKAEFNLKYEYYSEVAKAYDDLHLRADAIKKIDNALPVQESYGKLIYFLQKTAGEAGLVMKNMTLSKSGDSSEKQRSIKEISFSSNVTGTYASLGNFLVLLEKSARIFEINSISFSSNSSAGKAVLVNQAQFESEQTYNFNVIIKTYSY